MNFYFLIATLIITLVILLVWSIYEKVGTDREKIFFGNIVITIISVFLDIACQVVMKNYEIFGETIFLIVGKIYIFCVFFSIYLIVRYETCLLLDKAKEMKIRKYLLLSLIIFSIFVVILELDFEKFVESYYFVGPAMSECYFVCFTYLLVIIYLLIKYRKEVQMGVYLVVVFWIACLVFFAGIQVINQEIMVTSFGFASGLYYVYILVENPANNYNNILNCFNRNAFGSYLKTKFVNNEHESLVLLSVFYSSNKIMDKQENKITSDLLKNFIKSSNATNNIKIFDVNINQIAITSSDFLLLKQTTQNISKSIDAVKKSNDIKDGLYVSLFFVKDIIAFKNSGILMQIFNKYRINPTIIEDEIETHIMADEEINEIIKEYDLLYKIDNAIENSNYEMKYNLIHKNESDSDSLIQAEAELQFNIDDESLGFDRYINIIKKYNRIDDVAIKTFNSVCDMLTKIPSVNKLSKIFIKVSTDLVEEHNFAKNVIDKLTMMNIKSHNICFELVNTQTILKKETLVKNITQLQKHGITFSISGFGKGESNLNYFIDIPLQSIKYDKDVINLAHQEKNRALVIKEISNLAHLLNFEVTMYKTDVKEYIYEYADLIQDTDDEAYTETSFIKLVSEVN